VQYSKLAWAAATGSAAIVSSAHAVHRSGVFRAIVSGIVSGIVSDILAPLVAA
jgi:hypothetical protein